MSSPVLFSYRLEDGGGMVEADAATLMAGEAPYWVHLDSSHEASRSWLAEHLGLDEYLLDALLDEETRPRVLKEEEAAIMLLRGVNLNAGSSPEDMVTLRIYADGSRLVTLRGRRLMAATDVEAQLKKTSRKLDVGVVLCSLIDALLERMAPVLEDIDDKLDETEEKVIEHADASQRMEINTIRKQAILFRRYIAPQRDAIFQLRNLGFDWLGEIQRAHLMESHNHVQRYVEDLDAVRERAQIVKDELANILSDRMNRNTFVLTIVAAIFLPISFLTGLLGINVGGIPGAGNNKAFWIFTAILAVIVIMQITLFRKKKWF